MGSSAGLLEFPDEVLIRSGEVKRRQRKDDGRGYSVAGSVWRAFHLRKKCVMDGATER
jgi:hypothetical protein